MARTGFPGCFLLLACTWQIGYAQTGKNEWLTRLRNEIKKAAQYDSRKTRTIDSLKRLTPALSQEQLFEHYLNLNREYAVFIFDSAYAYSLKMEAVARQTGDSLKAKYASLNKNAVLLSSGMFKEVFESLNQFRISGLDDRYKAEYYVLKARSYFDLADYNRDTIFSKEYNKKGDDYVDSSLAISSPESFFSLYYRGLKNLRANQVRSATAYFTELAKNPSLSLHQQAILNSTFSDIYIRRGLTDSAIILLCKAAIADIRSSTKETTAILNLATLLFKKDDLENAVVFIQKAAADAKTYGARQRMVQLSNILPVIEAERVASIEREKHGIARYAAVITILLAFLTALAVVVIKQVRKLKKQQVEINKKNISLHHLVEEKEWLLKEVHHRVKNNLHTITSLLESQSAYLQDEALTAIRDSQHRVFAMSLVHQKLYQPENNVTSIDMAAYIHELAEYLKDSYQTGGRILFTVHTEPVDLDISFAVPLGLILNEAITNAVKYAFPGERKGHIFILAKKTADSNFVFSVSDNGVGLPAGLDIKEIQTLGMKLMKGLSEDMGASFSAAGRKGTCIQIELPIQQLRTYSTTKPAIQ